MSQENEKVIAKDKEDLKFLINQAMKENGYNCDLNFIDVSNVTDMSELFCKNFIVENKEVTNTRSLFNGSISEWDVSHVINMERMFDGSLFTGDISKWEVSNVTNMMRMFAESEFKGDISKWELSIDRICVDDIFASCGIPLSCRPKLKDVVANNDNIKTLVEKAIHVLGSEADLNFIDVSNVTNMATLFEGSSFSGDISKWDVSNVTDMARMFAESTFKGNIGKWVVPKVTNMDRLFYKSQFDSDISKWELLIDRVNMDNTFTSCGIPLSYRPKLKDVIANNDNIKALVERAVHVLGSEADLNFIDVSNVTNMATLFEGSSFSGDISKWDVSNVTDMARMFAESTFKGNIGKWVVPKVTNMDRLFYKSQFDSDISKWELLIDRVNMDNTFTSCGIPLSYRPKLKDVIANNENIKALVGKAIHVLGCKADLNFIDVSNVTDMSGLFYGSNFNGDISRWDVSSVTDMSYMFMFSDFTGNIGAWDVSIVRNMRAMFKYSEFNGDISKWVVSNVRNMSEMFEYSQFKGDISKWNVSNVQYMIRMFKNNKRFNGDISKWKVSSVLDMSEMFAYSRFNNNISKWNVSNVNYMIGMFKESEFNGDVSGWKISDNLNTYEMFKNSSFKGELNNFSCSNSDMPTRITLNNEIIDLSELDKILQNALKDGLFEYTSLADGLKYFVEEQKENIDIEWALSFFDNPEIISQIGHNDLLIPSHIAEAILCKNYKYVNKNGVQIFLIRLFEIAFLEYDYTKPYYKDEFWFIQNELYDDGFEEITSELKRFMRSGYNGLALHISYYGDLDWFYDDSEWVDIIIKNFESIWYGAQTCSEDFLFYKGRIAKVLYYACNENVLAKELIFNHFDVLKYLQSKIDEEEFRKFLVQADNPTATKYLIENPSDDFGITERYLAKKAEQGNKEAKAVVYEHYNWFDYCHAIIRWGDYGDKEAQQFIIEKYNELKKDYADNLRESITSWAIKGNVDAQKKVFENFDDFSYLGKRDYSQELESEAIQRAIAGEEYALNLISFYLRRYYAREEWAISSISGNCPFKFAIIPLARNGVEIALKLYHYYYKEGFEDDEYTKGKKIVNWANEDDAPETLRNFVCEHYYFEGDKHYHHGDDYDYSWGLRHHNPNIAEWAKEGNEKAKEILYDEYLHFQDAIFYLATHGDEKAKEILLQHPAQFENIEQQLKTAIVSWAKNEEDAKESIYDNPDLFKDILIEWAEESDTKAIKVIYENPSSFNEIIIKWAISGNVEARNFVLKHGYYFINEWTGCLINSDIKDAIIEWANGGEVEARDFIYKHPEIFKDTISEWANRNNSQAKEYIYENPVLFKETIANWAKEKDEKAKAKVYENYKNFEDVILEMAQKGDEKAKLISYEHFNKKDVYSNDIIAMSDYNPEARKLIFKYHGNFKDAILHLAERSDEEALQCIFDHYETFAKEICSFADNGIESFVNFVYSHYREKIFAKQILLCATEETDVDKRLTAFAFITKNPDIIPLIVDDILIYEGKGNEIARNIVFSHLDNEKFIQRICERSLENNQKAKTIAFSHLQIKKFVELIGKLAEQGDLQAKEVEKTLARGAERNGKEPTPFNVDSEYLETQSEKIMEEKEKRLKQFDFKVLYNGYSENAAVFDESKWLAIDQMRKLYPNAKFELVSENKKK